MEKLLLKFTTIQKPILKLEYRIELKDKIGIDFFKDYEISPLLRVIPINEIKNVDDFIKRLSNEIKNNQ